MSNIKRIVGFVVKAPKLAQIMLNIHELISATVLSQIFSGTGILAKVQDGRCRFRSNIKIAITLLIINMNERSIPMF